MVERICPTCQHGNPLDDRYCGKCGAQLERQLPARRTSSPLTIAGRSLPVSWQQLGKTVAISVVALAAEAGLAWLRQRIEPGAPAAAPLSRAFPASQPKQTETTAISRTGGRAVTIISQRVVELWDNGEGRRRVVERHFWRRTEE